MNGTGDTHASMVSIFAGGVSMLPADGRPSAIFKTRITDSMWLGIEGLAGDRQADRRVHGGPEKALHQYAVDNYAQLAARFPDAAPLLIPGSIGENLSAPGWSEATVHIGDVFRFGDALIQVSQPRSPCWKIDARYGVEGMAQFIEATGLCGWYFRVLQEGRVWPGCHFERSEVAADGVLIATFLARWREHRPTADELDALAAIPSLTPAWRKKLRERSSRLRQLG